jgi:hypothetical protein
MTDSGNVQLAPSKYHDGRNLFIQTEKHPGRIEYPVPESGKVRQFDRIDAQMHLSIKSGSG